MMTVPATINALDEKVPSMHPPIYWDRNSSAERNLKMIDGWKNWQEERIGGNRFVDEVSILVPDPVHERLLMMDLRLAGWEVFNVAQDLVYTNPFGTRYFVQYAFLKSPLRQYRLEVMQMGAGVEDGEPGFSPLHASLWRPNGKPEYVHTSTRYPIPHFSYKVADRREYSREVSRLMADQGFLHAQTCQSTYGAFGYYIHSHCPRSVYAKPRVNLRDTE
jgi:hypothetical protein